MLTSGTCQQCGNKLQSGDRYCKHCGHENGLDSSRAQIADRTIPSPAVDSPKSPIATLIFCLFLGMFGAHRFYVGKFGTGLLMLLTLGGLGIWFLFDLISIVLNKFEDKQGRQLKFIKSTSTAARGFLVIGALLSWIFFYVGTIAVLVFYLTSGVVAVVKEQLIALRSGDYDKAYSYTSKDFQKATTLARFKQFIEQYPSLKNNDSSFFNNREISNNTGMVNGTLTAKDGAKTPVQFNLIWEDGAWKILSIRVLPTGAGAEIDRKNEFSN